jgi:hypothetical protein
MTDEFDDTITLDAGWNNLGEKLRDAGYGGVLSFTFLNLTVPLDAPNPVYVFHHTSGNTAPVASPDGSALDQGESKPYPHGASGALKWLHVAAQTDLKVYAKTN